MSVAEIIKTVMLPLALAVIDGLLVKTGQSSFVIKTMNRLYREVQAISGASILGDGSVALILDVSRLIENPI